MQHTSLHETLTILSNGNNLSSIATKDQELDGYCNGNMNQIDALSLNTT